MYPISKEQDSQSSAMTGELNLKTLHKILEGTHRRQSLYKVFTRCPGNQIIMFTATNKWHQC